MAAPPPSPTLTGGHTASVLCVDTQRQSGQVVSGGEDGQLCLWSAEGQLVTRVSRPDEECTSVIFSRNNPNIVYAAFGEDILLLDVCRSQEPVFVFKSNSDELNQLALDAKEEFLGACDDSGETKVYRVQDRKVFKTLRHKHTNICSSVCFRPGRPWEVLTGGLDCRLVHWDFSKAKCLNQFNTQELFATPGESQHMINPPFVHHIAASPGGATFACGLENGQIPVLDAVHKNLRPRHSLFGHTLGVSQVHFLSEDGLVSAGNDSCIVRWDLSKASLYNPDVVHCNGDSGTSVASSVEEEKNIAISGLCKVEAFPRQCKVNWMAVRATDTGAQKLFVADQTPDISIIDL